MNQQKWKPEYDTQTETCKCIPAPDGIYAAADICTTITGCPKYIDREPGPWYILDICQDHYDHCNQMQYKCKGYEYLPSDRAKYADRSLKTCLRGFGEGHHVYMDVSQNKNCGRCTEADCKRARELHLLDDLSDPQTTNTWPNWFACKAGGPYRDNRGMAMDPTAMMGKNYYGNPVCSKGCCNIMTCL
jgi:hypothetical protein